MRYNEITITFTLTPREQEIVAAMQNVEPLTYDDLEAYIQDAVARALEADAWLVVDQKKAEWEGMEDMR